MKEDLPIKLSSKPHFALSIHSLHHYSDVYLLEKHSDYKQYYAVLANLLGNQLKQLLSKQTERTHKNELPPQWRYSSEGKSRMCN